MSPTVKGELFGIKNCDDFGKLKMEKVAGETFISRRAAITRVG